MYTTPLPRPAAPELVEFIATATDQPPRDVEPRHPLTQPRDRGGGAIVRRRAGRAATCRASPRGDLVLLQG
jgi:hypothetical protein